MEDGEILVGGGAKKEKKSKISGLIIFLAIVYVLFLLYQSVFFNFQRSQKIKSLKQEVTELQEKQEKINALIAYYKTESFQELEARRKLGLRMPGEKLIEVEVKSGDSNSEATTQRSGEEASDKKDDTRSNPELWMAFIAGRLN